LSQINHIQKFVNRKALGKEIDMMTNSNFNSSTWRHHNTGTDNRRIL